jgi:hypothetical protein
VEAIDGMARRAAEAGACFMAADPLFLKPCSRPTYLSFVREHFPSLVADYEKRFANTDFASHGYSRQISEIVGEACRKHGLGRRSMEADLTQKADDRKKMPASRADVAQRRLFA